MVTRSSSNESQRRGWKSTRILQFTHSSRTTTSSFTTTETYSSKIYGGGLTKVSVRQEDGSIIEYTSKDEIENACHEENREKSPKQMIHHLYKGN